MYHMYYINFCIYIVLYIIRFRDPSVNNLTNNFMNITKQCRNSRSLVVQCVVSTSKANMESDPYNRYEGKSTVRI